MKIDIDYLLKEKDELIAIGLLVFSLFLAIFLLFKITQFFTVSARAQKVITNTIEQRENRFPDTEQYLNRDREFARTLNEGNLFVRRASPENPVDEVRGIWIDSVLINDDWYKVDDVIDGARIVSIEPTQVTIEWEGRTYTYSPVEASIPEPQQTARTTTRARAGASREPTINSSFGATVSASGGAARMENVDSSGRAYRFGLRDGDIVISVNGQNVRGADSLVEILENVERGAAMEIQVQRNGTRTTVGRTSRNVGGNRGGRRGG